MIRTNLAEASFSPRVLEYLMSGKPRLELGIRVKPAQGSARIVPRFQWARIGRNTLLDIGVFHDGILRAPLMRGP
jgi:hypothetical protein